jgi:hypothetical protein
MKKLDRHTVQAVELTAPGACRQDADHLYSELREGRIFGAFTEQEREAVWRQLLAVSTDRLIPSLSTFFEDVKYLRGPAASVKQLVEAPDDGGQVSHRLRHSYMATARRIERSGAGSKTIRKEASVDALRAWDCREEACSGRGTLRWPG